MTRKKVPKIKFYIIISRKICGKRHLLCSNPELVRRDLLKILGAKRFQCFAHIPDPQAKDFGFGKSMLWNRLPNWNIKSALIDRILMNKKQKEITQTTVVIAYIIEIFLNQLSDLMHDKLYDEYDTLHAEFYKFLDHSQVKVNK